MALVYVSKALVDKFVKGFQIKIVSEIMGGRSTNLICIFWELTFSNFCRYYLPNYYTFVYLIVLHPSPYLEKKWLLGVLVLF